MRCGIVCWVALLALACAKAPEPGIVFTDAGDQMVRIESGELEMGSSSGEPDEAPVHRVRVDAFLMDRYEVTQAMLARLQLPDPSRVKGAEHPVDNVTWLQAARICNERSRAEKLEPCYDEATARCDFAKNGYRLPTEAEWEYACRAGGSADYGAFRDAGRLRDHAWFADNAAGRTHPVGTKKPNAWGLHDMHGNVAEWCNDAYDAGYYAKSPADNPRGPDSGELYAVRGGSWSSSANGLRAAARGRDRPGLGDACLSPDTLGLRCVRRAPGAIGR